MELILVASENFFNESQMNILKKHFSSISFVNENNIKGFNYNSNLNENKTLLLDPDYFDWEFPNEILANINNLNYVCLTTTTASYVDEEYLKNNGIKLITIPKYSTDSVAEYLIFLMFCVAKKLPLQLKNNNAQDFSDRYLQMEISNKKVGVVGLGNIGNRICEICKDIARGGVLYWNRTPKNVEFEYVSLESIFKDCDIVFITLANNAETRGLITDDLINLLKPNAILISNTGIALHNDNLVRDKIRNGQLYGFGAEIPNACFKDYDGNIMVTSEYAWFTKEATQRRMEILINNLLDIK